VTFYYFNTWPLFDASKWLTSTPSPLKLDFSFLCKDVHFFT
jgi:hypothetical protein